MHCTGFSRFWELDPRANRQEFFQYTVARPYAVNIWDWRARWDISDEGIEAVWAARNDGAGGMAPADAWGAGAIWRLNIA